MTEYLSPRESGLHVASHAKHVTINDDGVKKCAEFFAERLRSDRMSIIDLFAMTPVHPQKADHQGVDWVFFADALNFSFWTPESGPHYCVTYKVLQKWHIVFRKLLSRHNLLTGRKIQWIP